MIASPSCFSLLAQDDQSSIMISIIGQFVNSYFTIRLHPRVRKRVHSAGRHGDRLRRADCAVPRTRVVHDNRASATRNCLVALAVERAATRRGPSRGCTWRPAWSHRPVGTRLFRPGQRFHRGSMSALVLEFPALLSSQSKWNHMSRTRASCC